MGSKGGGGAQPPVSPSSVECCMCGDHGISRELFRCKSCHLRYQHKYCSDLYPKAEFYRTCNWCLREEGKKPISKRDVVTAENNNNNSSSISSSTTNENKNNNNDNSNSSSNGSSGSSNLKVQRGAFSSHLDKPVKKQRSLERSASEVIVRVRPEEMSTSRSGRGRQGFRGKIRRYKLLEEVSS